MEEHKLTNKFFMELLYELVKTEPKMKIKAESWLLIRKKIDEIVKWKK